MPYKSKINWFLLFIFIYCTFQTNAQVVSKLGRFSVENAIGCAPLTVNITLINDLGITNEPDYFYDAINNPNTNKLDTFHTYTQPGTYQLVQFLGHTNPNQPKEDTLMIVVHQLTTPQFKIHNCDNHKIRIEIKDNNYDFYRVFFTNTDFADIAPNSFSPEYNYGVAGNYPINVRGFYNNALDNCGSNNSSINTIITIIPPILTSAKVLAKDLKNGIIDITQTIGTNIVYDLEVSINNSKNFMFFQEVNKNRLVLNDINTVDNFYCYNIKTFNACTNTTFRSDTLCTILINLIAGDGANTINWVTETSVVDSYNIIRDNVIIAQINDPNIMTYDDLNILCKVNYKYQVQSIFTTGTTLSIDTTITAFKTINLPPLKFPFSSIVNQQVEITWPKVGTSISLSQYIIEKSNNNNSFKIIGTSNTTSYIDTNPNFFFPKKYRIRYDDKCNNRSLPSNETIPIFIRQNRIRGNEVSYSWSKYETWENGIKKYYLERIDNNGLPFEEISILSSRNHILIYSPNDNRPKKVRIRAESLDPIPQISYSNVIESKLGLQIYFPTAFTPNGDNLNDEYKPKGPLVFNFKMEIYSRWGELIFITNDIQKGWNGTFNENNTKTDAYIYKATFEDIIGTKYKELGSFVLLRD